MDPFLGSIMVVSFDFAPKGWTLCNGQILPISQNTALFSLLGTTFGGDGRTTFQLPNLQARAALGANNGSYPIGISAGETTHTLSTAEMAAHNHLWNGASAAASTPNPAGGVLAQAGLYTSTPNVQMSSSLVTATGGGQPHENRSPFLALNFCIALQGIFPSRT